MPYNTKPTTLENIAIRVAESKRARKEAIKAEIQTLRANMRYCDADEQDSASSRIAALQVEREGLMQ